MTPQPASLSTSSETQPSGAAPSSKPGPQGAGTLSPGLYVVATPIGNLGDISQRAIDVLSTVDRIYCEDTRITSRLTQRIGCPTSLSPYHDHNGDRVRPQILQLLSAGKSCALVSDAGTPLISDPGYKLVRACRDADLPVHVVPGPSAVMAALSVSGLPTDKFLFLGFPPTKAKAMEAFFREYAVVPVTLVLFESAKRLAKTVSAAAKVLPGREAAVCRELTKKFEQVIRCKLAEMEREIGPESAPKGEIVLIIGPPETDPSSAEPEDTIHMAEERLRVLLDDGMRMRDAVDAVSAQTGLARRMVYDLALSIRKTIPDQE